MSQRWDAKGSSASIFGRRQSPVRARHVYPQAASRVAAPPGAGRPAAPTVRVLACCEFGKISTLAAATLRELGFTRAVALDGGLKAWRDAGYELES